MRQDQPEAGVPGRTDRELLEACGRAGAGEAWAEIIRRHGPMVLGVCRRVLGDAHAAEDAAQVTFLALSRKTGRLVEGRIPLAPWLYRAARLSALKSREKGKIRHRYESEAGKRAALETRRAATGEDVLRGHLDAGLESLPATLRDAVVLRYLSGLSDKEAAQALGCGAGAVTMRVSRGLDRLRKYLARYGFAGSTASLAGLMAAGAASALPADFAAAAASACSGHAMATAVARQAAHEVARAMSGPGLKVLTMAGAGALGLATSVGIGLAVSSAFRPGPTAPRDDDVEFKVVAEWPVAAPGAPRTTTPSGDYRAARITLHDLPASDRMKSDCHLDGGFRQGRMPVFGRHSHRDLAGQLELQGDAITGSFPFGRPGDRMPEFKLTIEARIAADGSVGGTYSGEMWPMFNLRGPGQKVGGSVGGVVRAEPQLAALQKGFAVGASWPTWAGPAANFSATPTGSKLVDDLAKARLLWRSEQTMPQGPGSLFTMRTPHRSLYNRSGGGGASPVFAGGRIYVSYFEANVAAAGLERRFKWNESMDRFRAERVAQGEWTIAELHPETLSKYALRGDQVMLCLDAVTGKTLWKTVIPNAGFNRQSHKVGPMNCTPAASEGRVFAMDIGGRMNALDAETGLIQWSVPLGPDSGAGTREWNQAPIAIGGALVCGDQGSTLWGLDPATGKTIWKVAQGTGRDTPIGAPWTRQGKDYVLTMGTAGAGASLTGALRLIDPADGRVLWTLPLKRPGKGVHVYGDIALFFIGHREPDEDETGPKDRTNGTLACKAIRLGTDQPHDLWTVPCGACSNGNLAPVASPDGRVCLAGATESRLLDLQTGRELAACKVQGPTGEGQVEQVEDRFLITMNSSHGVQALTLLCDSTDAFGPMGTTAYPFVHPQTSGYQTAPMSRCYVDGRLFIRGMDGIYCYDLRQ